jgi:hypothetical protein
MTDISADTQIGALRDTILAGERMALDMDLDPLTQLNQQALRAALRTVTAARALYENRASSDPKWLSDLFHAVAPL